MEQSYTKNSCDSKKAEMATFESVYMCYFNELYRFAYHYIMSEEANDVVQEVFVKLYENMGELETNTNIRAYLYALTKNRCLDFLKRLKVRSKHQESLIQFLLDGASFEDEECDGHASIDQVIELLPEMQRKIIQLRLSGKDYNEIAQILNIKTGSVNTHINRAYKKIRRNTLLFFIYLTQI